MIERIDSVEIDAVRALAAELFTPTGMSVAGVGPAESEFHAAIAPLRGLASDHADAQASSATAVPGAPR
jgi:hypothetical protein